MRSSSPCAATAVISVLLAAGSSAQAPAPDLSRSLVPFVVPVHTAAADQGTEYGIWAAGHRYKASFHDGMTFVPYLGAGYPNTVTWQWHTQSVRIGEVELVGARQLARWTDWRVEYDLGEVVEAYDVRGEGLEQTFVVKHRPAVGDLVVRGAVATTLGAPETAAQHQSLGFADAAGNLLVTYGAATAIDATGQRRAMTTAFVNGAVELRLSADWLAGAAFPVVVDPMLGASDISFGNTVVGMDLVHSNQGVAARQWMAWSRATSATDNDLYVRRSDEDGSNQVTVYSDITVNWSTFEPTCTYVREPDCGLIAFTREFLNGERAVRWHRHARTDLTSNTSFGTVNSPNGVHLWRPDLGGTRQIAAGSAAMLVVQGEASGAMFSNTTTSAIHGCVLDMTGNGSAGALFAIHDAALVDAERPSVNQYDDSSLTARWIVAYQVANTIAIGGNATWDVVVRQVRGDGTVSAALVVDASGTAARHEMAPQVAGTPGTFLVAMTSSTTAQQLVRPSTANGHQLRVARIDWTYSSPIGQQAHPTATMQSNNDARLELGGLALDTDSNSHWGVLYRSNVTESLYFETVGYTGATVQSATAHGGNVNHPTVAGGVSYSSSTDTYMLGYAVNGNPPGSGQVRLNRFELSPVVPNTVTGIGCSAASIAWNGGHRVGEGASSVGVEGAPAGALQAMIVGLQPVNQPLLGIPGVQSGCWLLVPSSGPDHLAILPLQFGTSGLWNVPLPEWLDTMPLYFQGCHSNTAVTEFQTTQRLQVNVVR